MSQEQQYAIQTVAFLRSLGRNPLGALRSYPFGCRTQDGREAYREAALKNSEQGHLAQYVLRQYLDDNKKGDENREVYEFAEGLLCEIANKRDWPVAELTPTQSQPVAATPPAGIERRQAKGNGVAREVEQLLMLLRNPRYSEVAQTALIEMAADTATQELIFQSYVRDMAAGKVVEFTSLEDALGGHDMVIRALREQSVRLRAAHDRGGVHPEFEVTPVASALTGAAENGRNMAKLMAKLLAEGKICYHPEMNMLTGGKQALMAAAQHYLSSGMEGRTQTDITAARARVLQAFGRHALEGVGTLNRVLSPSTSGLTNITREAPPSRDVDIRLP